MSDKPGCGGVAFAAQLGIPTLTHPAPAGGAAAGADAGALDASGLAAALLEGRVDFVLLAGYLKLVRACYICTLIAMNI